MEKFPQTPEDVARLIAKRDKISYIEALASVRDAMAEMELAFMNGSLDDAEEILRTDLGLEPDYLDCFIL